MNATKFTIGMINIIESYLKITIKLIICICSIISSFAISDSFGFKSNKLNASIAILCSIISLILSCIRAGIHAHITDQLINDKLRQNKRPEKAFLVGRCTCHHSKIC